MDPFQPWRWKLLVVLLFIPLGCSRFVTRHIDDQHGDSVTGVRGVPIYFGDGQWVSGSDCPKCHGTLQPDPAKAFDGTWHDSTRRQGMPSYGFNFSFTGVSFTIFCILPNSPTGTMSSPKTSLAFTVDDEPAGNYTHTSDDTKIFVYDAPVFSMRNMANKEHNVMVELSASPSVVLFDYVEYTFDDGESGVASTSTSTSIGDDLPTPTQGNSSSNQGKSAIVLGAVLGSILMLMVAM
ncbi:hypothetical protein Moror_4642 [Moniliophthora roreri MCA 2997]|uniref:Uncharacterized protein n=2 Tax=Moniliophthora roreri TaxID=221103 RepID=V2WZM0_MONRO|nr:hypothetical protein Moror_4642 [Moniliophthora roreri MCA 2997]